MFCHKCGAQIAEGAAFCQKCGTKVVHTDDVQQPMDTTTPIAEPQSAGAVGSTIAEDTSSNNPPKGNSGLRKAATIGSILMWGSLALLALTSFFHLSIPPAIPVAGVAIGIILSTLGAKRPWGLSKILELVSAVILLVIVVVFTLSSGGTGDKYVQLVKDGTLEAYPQMTVGEAFNGFLSDPKWESARSDDEVRFVNVSGGIIYDDEEAEIVVQFIVDEENKSFQYYACEINNIPQNDLVVWGLFETIYGDPSSTGSDAQGDPDFISDKIIIGETQSYDNEYGNIEVTLNYTTFTDKLKNTLLGGYIYPDEGNVFLWADITVKNIGTENGDLITAWNTVIYDGTYEFRSYNTIGDPLINIAPLTAPTEGAIIFEVPSGVMESDKSLVLNINDIDGSAVLSYIIRPGDGTTDNGSAINSNGELNNFDSDDFYYGEKCLTDLLDKTSEEVSTTLGMPTGGTPVTGELLYGGTEYWLYNDELGLYFDNSTVSGIRVRSEVVTRNGITLNMTDSEIRDEFGEPSYEKFMEENEEGGGYYFMEYLLNGIIVGFEIPDTSNTADSITLSLNN